jgi:hypothetical protein
MQGNDLPRYTFRILSKSLRVIHIDINISECVNVVNAEESKGLSPIK